MTDAELDQLVARADETIGSHESAPMARFVHQLAAAITALRERVADEKKAANHWFTEAQRDHNDLVRRDRRIAELEADAELVRVIERAHPALVGKARYDIAARKGEPT